MTAKSERPFLLRELGPLVGLTLVAGLFSPANAQQDAGEHLSSAMEYLATLPADIELFVWPSPTRIVEAISLGRETALAVNLYVEQHNEIVWIRGAVGPPPQISIYEYDSIANVYFLQNYMAQSRLLPDYLAYAPRLRFSQRWCAFGGFTDSDTWAAGGLLFIDRSQAPPNEIPNCVWGALDYFNGLPAGQTVTIDDLPGPGARRLILKAIAICATESRDGGGAPVNGLYPLPPLSCVPEKLRASATTP